MRSYLCRNFFGFVLFFAMTPWGMADSSTRLNCYTFDGTWRTSGEPIPPLNYGLNRYAFSNFGRSVGSGECAEIPYLYLRGAGAKNFNDLGPTHGNADYVWGDLVTVATPGHVDLSEVLVGDIVQMRDVRARFRWGNTTYTQKPVHHTAIVNGISPDNKDFCVLEQGPGSTIGYGWYNLNGLEAGTMWFYRPKY